MDIVGMLTNKSEMQGEQDCGWQMEHKQIKILFWIW